MRPVQNHKDDARAHTSMEATTCRAKTRMARPLSDGPYIGAVENDGRAGEICSLPRRAVLRPLLLYACPVATSEEIIGVEMR